MARISLLLGLVAVSGSLAAVAGQQDRAAESQAGSKAAQRVVAPLPTRESIEAPAGWKPDGHVVPHMPETLLRLPRTPLTRAKYPAIDFHVHAGDLKTVEAYQTFIKKMDEAGIGAIINLNGGTGANLDAALKAGEGFKDRVANFVTFSAEGINEPGWSEKFAAEMERGFKAGAQGLKVAKGLGLGAKNPDGTYIQCDDPRLDAVWAMAAKVQRAGDDPRQRLDRPLLSDQPEERALRSRIVGQAWRHGGQLLQERLSGARGDREGAREHAPQASRRRAS